MRWIILLALFWSGLATAQDKVSGFYVFYKKPDSWKQVYLYTWFVQNNKVVEPTGSWPGKALADVAGWYRGFIDQTQTDPLDQSINLIFSSGAGQQTADLKRKDNGWYAQNQWYDLNPDEKLYQVTVQNGTGSGTYSPGTLVKIQATPPQPGLFLSWSGGDGLLVDNTRVSGQFSMPARNVTLQALYEDLKPGQTQYQTLCVGCHGKAGEGGVGPSLQLAAAKCASCTQDATLETRISQTMPLGRVGQCTGTCAHDVARYIRYGLNTQSAIDCTAPANNLGRRQLRLLTEREYRNSIKDILGISTVDALKFWPEAANVAGYTNNAEASLVSDRHLLVFAKAAKEIAGKFTTAINIEQIGQRLFRRPLSSTEIETYKNSGASALEIMLQSPSFLYRSEMGAFIAPRNAYSLDNYELAAALAFTLTGSSPDEKLLAAAADGSIKTAETRRTQAQRLLEMPAARATFGDFATQWLGISALPYLTRDNTRLTAALRADMLEETQRFLGQLIFDQNAAVKDLYAAPQTFVSQKLASHYGLPVPNQNWDAVSYDGERRGLIAQGSIHVTYGNAREASPIKRGVFVRNRLLCQDLPPPPANVDTTIPPPSPGLTMRERLARHLSQGVQADGSNSCFSCHQYIDKVGFGFERFDEVGLFRRAYAEKPEAAIDVSGEIKSPLALNDPNTQSFQNFSELSTLLSENPSAKTCFGVQYLRYAQGYVEQGSDQCLKDSLGRQLQSDHSIRDVLIEFVSSDNFLWRK